MKYIEDIYNKYFHDVRLFVKSMSHDDNIAEEITQETFFKAIKTINTFKAKCDVKVWLCQIAKNTYFTYCKKNNRFISEEISETIPDENTSIEENFENKNIADNIQKILEKLNEPYKEVFSLRVYKELSFYKISQQFNKSESWARVTFHRAKLKIIEKLEEKI